MGSACGQSFISDTLEEATNNDKSLDYAIGIPLSLFECWRGLRNAEEDYSTISLKVSSCIKVSLNYLDKKFDLNPN